MLNIRWLLRNLQIQDRYCINFRQITRKMSQCHMLQSSYLIRSDGFSERWRAQVWCPKTFTLHYRTANYCRNPSRNGGRSFITCTNLLSRRSMLTSFETITSDLIGVRNANVDPVRKIITFETMRSLWGLSTQRIGAAVERVRDNLAQLFLGLGSSYNALRIAGQNFEKPKASTWTCTKHNEHVVESWRYRLKQALGLR